jgi:hypothetical protein
VATTPTYSQVEILYSRVAHDPGWSKQLADLVRLDSRPKLTNRWEIELQARRPALVGGGRFHAMISAITGTAGVGKTLSRCTGRIVRECR